MFDHKKLHLGLGVLAACFVTTTSFATTGKATSDSRTVQDGTPVRTRVTGFAPPGAQGNPGGVPSYCGLGYLRGSFRAFDEYSRIIIDSDGYWATESKSNPIDGVANVGPSSQAVCKSLDELGIPLADYGLFTVTNVNSIRAGSKSPYTDSATTSLSTGHLLQLAGINGRLWALGGDQAAAVVDLGAPILSISEKSECGYTTDDCTMRTSVWDGAGSGYTFHYIGDQLGWVDGTAGVSDFDTGYPVSDYWCYIGGVSGTWNADAEARIVDSGATYHLRVKATTTTARARAYATCIELPQFP